MFRLKKTIISESQNGFQATEFCGVRRYKQNTRHITSHNNFKKSQILTFIILLQMESICTFATV